MKRYAPFAVLAVLAFASPSRADRLLIFSDAALTDSTLNDNAPRVANVYVVHSNAFAATGIRFRIVAGPGFTGVWLGDTSSFVTVGNSTTDVAIGYGACLTGSVRVLTATYQLFGTSTACSGLSIAPALGSPCVLTTSFCGGLDEGCVGSLGTLHTNCPVATEPTTWGSVKALYQD